jgi:glutathione synthase/RimK-type ligase-like ATP-grasp enzyme
MRPRRCALLTLESLEGYFCDDELLAEPLQRVGLAPEWVAWDRPADWDRFEFVVLRSTWDYHVRPAEFLAVLESIERSRARLENPLSLVRWNLHKGYLAELQDGGVAVVPTRVCRGLEAAALERAFEELETEEIVVKPAIGANAMDTSRLRREDLSGGLARLAPSPRQEEYLIQPFRARILDEGELSLVYLGGAFSHAVRKTPRAQDFRVQEEHGGRLEAVRAGDEAREAGARAMEVLPQQPLYARVDLVRDDRGRWELMELELIEPSLYLRQDPGAAARFARCLVDR